MLQRAPVAPLRPFIRLLWASEAPTSQLASVRPERERVLPTGLMHLVFRLSEPLRLFASQHDSVGFTRSHAVVGGARSSHYLKDISAPTASVGAQLEPGAARLLFGVPASALAEHHTALDDLWGRERVDRALDALRCARDAAARLACFETLLGALLPRVRGVHPAVSSALATLGAAPELPIGRVVERSGYSHRAFAALFRDAVGLTPKIFQRVTRFQRAVAELSTDTGARSAEVALASGYSDQPHFNREFRSFSGITPVAFRAASPAAPNHVPVLAFDTT